MLPVVEWPPKTGAATCCFQGTRALLCSVPGAEPRPATHLNLILLIPFHTLLIFHILQDIKPRTLSTSSINTIRRSFTIKLNTYPEDRNSSFLKAYVLDRFGGGKGLMNEFKSSSRLYWKNHP